VPIRDIALQCATLTEMAQAKDRGALKGSRYQVEEEESCSKATLKVGFLSIHSNFAELKTGEVQNSKMQRKKPPVLPEKALITCTGREGGRDMSEC